MRSPVLTLATCLALLVAIPAQAEKPGGKGGVASPAAGSPAGGVQITIAPRDQNIIRSYYGQRFANGNCPPGLAKKNNGCMPPGQAKSWSRGQPLGNGIAYSPLPPDLLAMLSTPIGYQFVRILNDVLLIADGNRLVVDAVPDLR